MRTAPRQWLPAGVWVAGGLAFAVVLLGAFVRLSDAGLGCPDWPGCYGRIVVPEALPGPPDAFGSAARPLTPHKAWREMVHRYAAGTLGLLVLWLALAAWRRGRDRTLAGALVALVVGQALLGMWTVTLLLQPVVVTAHLLGGMTTLALLWWLALRNRPRPSRWQGTLASAARGPVIAALVVVGLQIALGGWTASHYAALACTDFPTCQGRWWPQMDFASGFSLLHEPGRDYEYGVLDTPARTAIHFTHRLGALVTAVVVLALAGTLARHRARGAALALLLVLAVQVSLGIANVLLGLPLPVAVAHNGGAATLLLVLVTLLHRCTRPRPEPTD